MYTYIQHTQNRHTENSKVMIRTDKVHTTHAIVTQYTYNTHTQNTHTENSKVMIQTDKVHNTHAIVTQ